jgi:Mg/Co/Ni transporter MgtE
VLLSKDLRARHLINLQGARLIRANEIELARVDGRWEVVAVDPSPRVALRRLLPRVFGRRIPAGKVVDWASIEPFVAHVPTARLRIPYRKLARLHPAQIADLVEAASHEEGEEIIEAVGQDRELEADVFEELDAEHQIEFVRSRSDAEAARLLATMAPDDAADLIVELDQDHRLPVLQLLPLAQQRKIRSLLNYNPETAGGLMSPDFLCLAESTPVSDVLEAVRNSQAPPEALAVVFARGNDGRVSGSASVVVLVQASPAATLGSVVRPNPAHVHPDWDLHAVTRKMTDFNLTVAPVMDEQHRMVGVITVDDLLEMLLPTGWRRDFGMTSVEE